MYAYLWFDYSYKKCVEETLYYSGQICSGVCTPARRFHKTMLFQWDMHCELRKSVQSQCELRVSYFCFSEVKVRRTTILCILPSASHVDQRNVMFQPIPKKQLTAYRSMNDNIRELAAGWSIITGCREHPTLQLILFLKIIQAGMTWHTLYMHALGLGKWCSSVNNTWASGAELGNIHKLMVWIESVQIKRLASIGLIDDQLDQSITELMTFSVPINISTS